MDTGVAAWLLGAVLGARHALEPDHLAAVSTLVAGRPRPSTAALLGALWGIGHAAALLVVGAVLILGRRELPTEAIVVAEIGVAAMLIFLGVRSLVVARRPERPGTMSSRPLAIGVIHGLAGSGGLAVLALAEMPTAAAAFGYIAAFALGSVVGMAAVSGLAGAALARVASSPRGRVALLATSGALSVIVGIVWATIAITAAG